MSLPVIANYSASNMELNKLYKHTGLFNSTMSCCICMGSDNLMKVKCCNQQFHVDCLNQWLQQKKFTCPMCCNVKDFVGLLPCMRQAVTDELERMSRQGFRMYIQRSNIICGVIVIGSYPEVWGRLLRSNSLKGFFF